MEGTQGKDHEENGWDQIVESNVVEGLVEKVAHEIVEAMQKIKLRKETGPSEAGVEIIVASGETGVKVMMKLFQCVLDGREIPDGWKTIAIASIFNSFAPA